jgi:hypothetical protein
MPNLSLFETDGALEPILELTWVGIRMKVETISLLVVII